MRRHDFIGFSSPRRTMLKMLNPRARPGAIRSRLSQLPRLSSNLTATTKTMRLRPESSWAPTAVTTLLKTRSTLLPRVLSLLHALIRCLASLRIGRSVLRRLILSNARRMFSLMLLSITTSTKNLLRPSRLFELLPARSALNV
ncbi:hypothetical protein RSAG8_09067, partial [Rhizoctonia solani AG-8 WAC10335]